LFKHKLEHFFFVFVIIIKSNEILYKYSIIQCIYKSYVSYACGKGKVTNYKNTKLINKLINNTYKLFHSLTNKSLK